MRILLLTAIFIFASSASAGLYKWVDSEGNVHYSQKRPANQQFKRLKEPPPAPEDSKVLYKSTEKSEKASTTLSKENAKNEKIREENCASAKKQLSGYTVYRRFRDKDGNVSVVDDKVRAERIKESEQAVNDYCN